MLGHKQSLDLWVWDTLVGKSIALQLSLHFGGFPTLEQPWSAVPVTATPLSAEQQHTKASPFLIWSAHSR